MRILHNSVACPEQDRCVADSDYNLSASDLQHVPVCQYTKKFSVQQPISGVAERANRSVSAFFIPRKHILPAKKKRRICPLFP
jgi:hypothetical protein